MNDKPDDDRQPWETEVERSTSGDPIWRYEDGERPFEMAVGDGTLIQAMDAHLDKHLPGPRTVLHELVSDQVHVDVHVSLPTESRPHYTLVTSGMAQRPMRPPPGDDIDIGSCEFAELMLCLPPDWPGFDTAVVDDDHPWRQERYFWPINMLKMLARFPHTFETWLWEGHTVPQGDPPEVFEGTAGLAGVILYRPKTLPETFHQFRIGDRDVHVFALVPLHEDEMDFKLRYGADALEERLDKAQVTEVLDPQRPSVIGKSGRPWWKRLLG